MTAAPPASPALPARPTAPRAFGRFELRQLLGRSSRSMVWLAWDPRVQQELMLTMPRTPRADSAAAAAWLDASRRIARLSHPCLAPVIDCDVHELWPYVTCDRGSRRTLVETLADQSPLGHQDIARWLGQALEGLAYAHDAGAAHLDLQLHHLLIDDRRQLRVMALGVAAAGAVNETPASGHAGSKGMPMDLGVLRAQRAAAERDVLSVGVMAHQLLADAAALDESDIGRVIERMAPIGQELVRLPWTTPLPISDVLRAIANRATHSQPRQRYLSARTFVRALDGWRAADAEDTGGPVALLLDRLHSVGHLPATPGLALTVARLSRMERERTNEMAEQILLDLALSFELLRLVNSAQVRGTQVSGNGPVLTIRRAIAMLGLDGVRHAAQGLRTWPGPLNDGAAAALEVQIQRARLAGHLAQQLRPAGYDPEVVFLIAVLQNLGRLLLTYHFPEDAEQIAALMRHQPPATAGGPEQAGMDEEAASQAVLGVEVDALATACIRHWGLPDEVVGMIRRLPVERPVHAPEGDSDLLRAVASAANEVVDALIQGGGAPRIGPAVARIHRRYGKLLGVSAQDISDALREAKHAQATGVPLVAAEAQPPGPAADGDGAAATGS